MMGIFKTLILQLPWFISWRLLKWYIHLNMLIAQYRINKRTDTDGIKIENFTIHVLEDGGDRWDEISILNDKDQTNTYAFDGDDITPCEPFTERD